MLKQNDIITYRDGRKAKIFAVCGELVAKSWVDDFERFGTWITEQELVSHGWTFPKEDWTPRKGEEYWHINPAGEVCWSTWNCEIYDVPVKKFLGVYKDKESAEKALAEIKVKLGK